MTLRSMTGFARVEGAHASTSWHCEIRSVNGRGLDLRLRLPPGHDALEARVREVAMARLARGSITINLTLQRQDQGLEIRLNERTLAQVAAAAERLRQVLGAEPVRAEALLGVRGVLEFVEPTETEGEAAARMDVMLRSLDRTLVQLIAAREEEGARLAKVLSTQIDDIEALVDRITISPARRPEAVAQRLRDLVARIGDSGVPLDPQRLHQEAVMIATRADVEEELKRLTSHVAAARQLLAANEPAGRKLDFLAQEFFREANTLCAKSSDGDMTHLGLELKRIIDQMREQVQNIE